MCEGNQESKYCKKNKCVYLTFMDMETVYYRADRRAMWQVLQMYAGNGRLRKAMKKFYEKNKAMVRVCRKQGRSYDVAVGLGQGCTISPWMFMDGVKQSGRQE